MQRRTFLLAMSPMLPGAAGARPARSGGARLRCGADLALVESGLAEALRRAFGRETGLAVDIVAAPALPLLEALAAGEMDVALSNVRQAELRLVSEGLGHDRRPVVDGGFVLVGPAAVDALGSGTGAAGRPGKPGLQPSLAGQAAGAGPGGSPVSSDVAGMLQRIRNAARQAPNGPVFLSAADGSGTHLAEQEAWRLAGVAPEAPWYRHAEPGRSLVEQALARDAFALVERGAWSARGKPKLLVLAEDRVRLAEGVHILRSFRSPHSAGRLFVDWVSGPRGRGVASGVRGYRPVSAGRA